LVWVTPTPGNIPRHARHAVSGTLAQLMMTRAYQLAPARPSGPFILRFGRVLRRLFDWLNFFRGVPTA